MHSKQLLAASSRHKLHICRVYIIQAVDQLTKLPIFIEQFYTASTSIQLCAWYFFTLSLCICQVFLEISSMQMGIICISLYSLRTVRSHIVQKCNLIPILEVLEVIMCTVRGHGHIFKYRNSGNYALFHPLPGPLTCIYMQMQSEILFQQSLAT